MAALLRVINESPSNMLLAEELGWPVSVHYTTATDHEKPSLDIVHSYPQTGARRLLDGSLK